MPHDMPATRKPIGGAIRNPPTALNSINESISKFAEVVRFNFDFRKTSVFFIPTNLAHKYDILIELIEDKS